MNAAEIIKKLHAKDGELWFEKFKISKNNTLNPAPDPQEIIDDFLGWSDDNPFAKLHVWSKDTSVFIGMDWQDYTYDLVWLDPMAHIDVHEDTECELRFIAHVLGLSPEHME